MQFVINLQQDSSDTLQTQICDQFSRMICDGILKPGAELPSTRELAGNLSISRNTVFIAYEHLAAEGYIVSRPTQGTYVSEDIPDDLGRITNQSDIEASLPIGLDETLQSNVHPHSVVSPNRNQLPIDFWPGVPDSGAFPRRIWRRLLIENFENLEENSRNTVNRLASNSCAARSRRTLARLERLRSATNVSSSLKELKRP